MKNMEWMFHHSQLSSLWPSHRTTQRPNHLDLESFMLRIVTSHLRFEAKMRGLSDSRYILLSQSGAVLIIGLMFLVILSLIGLGSVYTSTLEGRAAGNIRAANEALYLAESGLERISTDLTYDWTVDGDWGDTTLTFCQTAQDTGANAGLQCMTNGSITLTDTVYSPTADDPSPLETSWTTATSPYTPVATTIVAYGGSPAAEGLGTGTYQVQLIRRSGSTEEVWVRSTGTTASGASKTLQAHYAFNNESVWSNAIFGGSGAGGGLINGGVTIAGSVHVLGTDPTTTVMALGGNAGIQDNYTGTLCESNSRIPPLGVGNELETKVRVKKGKIDLSGNGHLGQASDNVDGVYVTGDDDGAWVGANDDEYVWSDNCAWPCSSPPGYDMGDNISMPSFTDSVEGYSTYWDYVTTEGINPTSGSICEISTNTAAFTCTASGACAAGVDATACNAATNCLMWDGTGQMTIKGIVTTSAVVPACTQLDLAVKGSGITYSGKGSLIATGATIDDALNVHVHDDLLTVDGAGTDDFPVDNALALLTRGVMELATGGGESQLSMMGMFFAETKIKSAKQNAIAGSMVTNVFDLGSQVPTICYIPKLKKEVQNIPGLIAVADNVKFATREWSEVNY